MHTARKALPAMVTEYPHIPAGAMPPPFAGRRRRRTGTAGLAGLPLLSAGAGAARAAAQPWGPAATAAEAGTWTPERAAFGRVMPSRDATLSLPFAATVTQLS